MITTLNNLSKKILPSWIYDKLIGRWDSDGLKRYSTNALWALFARVVNIFVSFFVTIYLVRYLGPESYGQLSYAVAFVGIFSIIAAFGIDHILYRDLVKYPDKRGQYLGTAFVLKLFFGVIATLLSIGAAFLFSENDVSRIVIFLISITFILSSFNVINTEFQANTKQKYVAIISIAISVVLNLLKLVVIFINEGIVYIGLILLLEAILYAVLLTIIRLKKLGNFQDWKFSRKVARSLVFESWPFIFISGFTIIYSRVDQIIIKNILDAHSVGIYDAGVRIAEFWGFVPAVIAVSLFPAIINSRKTNLLEYKKRLLILSALILILSIAFVVPIVLFAEVIILTVYGPAFLAAANVLIIYGIGSIFAALSNVGQLFLINESKRKTIFYLSLSTATFNIVLNFMLIPKYGINGAAFATLLSYVLLIYPLLLIARIK